MYGANFLNISYTNATTNCANSMITDDIEQWPVVKYCREVGPVVHDSSIYQVTVPSEYNINTVANL